MTYDNSLAQLQQAAGKKYRLEAKLRELREQKKEFDRKVISLKVVCRQEQEDVEKLEGRSLANYFFHVIGKLDDKLTKERQEAYAAKVKLDAAERELAGIEEDIRQHQAELAETLTAEIAYKEALEKKQAALRTSGTPAGQQLLEIEEKLAALKAKKQELREAIAAGRSAQGIAERILSELDSADSWNTWDIVAGGGILSHMEKHGHLDNAQDMVEELQNKLRNFKTELADIRISAELQVNIDGFLRFADYFFDSLFTDWAVGDRISESRSAIQGTKNKISQMLTRLKSMEASEEREITRLTALRENVIVKA